MFTQILARSIRFSIWSMMALMMFGFLSACGGDDDDAPLPPPPVVVAPDAPEMVSALSGDAEVTVDWGDVADTTSYNIYWSTTVGVIKTTGTKIADVSAPYVHSGLINGTTYYYVVTAVGAGGESVESAQVSAVPQVPEPTAPQNVTAVLTPETTKSVTVSWSEPSDGLPILSYNLYRSLAPDIASDLAAATKFEDVISPYVDVVPAGQVTYYYVVTAVNAGGESLPSAEVSATPKGPPGSGGASLYGNNLSVPLVFADGIGVTGLAVGAVDSDYLDRNTGLRPTLTDITDPFPYLNANDVVVSEGLDYYPQRTSSSWQANWINGKPAPQSVLVDWGDNLVSASLTASQSVIRVETNLVQDKGVPAAEGLVPSWPDTESMKAYPMKLLGGQGIEEVQGTTGVAEEASRRRVFAINARLTIQKLVGDVAEDHVCGFTGSIAEGFALADNDPNKYSSEINVAGAITYGFNWRLAACAAPIEEKRGAWRLTFSLDDVASHGGDDYPNNVSLDGLDASETSSVLVDTKTTYIDVVVN